MKPVVLLTAAAVLSLAAVALYAQTPRGGLFGPFEKQMIEGQPIDTRTPEKADDHPVFAGQTRAPYHKSVAVAVKVLNDSLNNPWALAILPDGKFLITEKPGAMRILNADGTADKNLTGVPAVVAQGQVGLLEVVLDKNFAANHRIFFSYMEAAGADQCNIAIARATLDEAAGALKEMTVIYRTAPYARRQTANSAGRIAIDPKDGSLFVSIGDRSSSPPWQMAQQLDTALGKLLHITVDGKPAPGNPFARTPGALAEIYSLGHRTEEGLAFDNKGRLWEVEDGPRGGDELNAPEPGKNYGWPVIVHGIDYPGATIGDGIVEKAGMQQPRYYWDPVIAPSGLAFYDGNLFAAWKDSVLIGALRGQMLDRLALNGDKVVGEEPLLTDLNARIREVKVGPDGAVYVMTDGANAKLLKLTPATEKT